MDRSGGRGRQRDAPPAGQIRADGAPRSWRFPLPSVEALDFDKPDREHTTSSGSLLSTARATTVLHFLQDKVGVSGERLSAVGYGEYQPIASNATAEGRAENRRIQIVLTAAKAP